MKLAGIRILLLVISKGFVRDTKKKWHAAHLSSILLPLLLSIVGFLKKKKLVTAQAVGIPKTLVYFLKFIVMQNYNS